MDLQPNPTDSTAEVPAVVPDSAQLELTRGETCVLLRYIEAGAEAIGSSPKTLFDMLHINAKHGEDVKTLTQKLAVLGQWFINAEKAAEQAESETPAQPEDLNAERDVL